MAVNNPLADSRVAQSISQPPSAGDFAVDRAFTALAMAAAAAIILLVAYIL